MKNTNLFVVYLVWKGEISFTKKALRREGPAQGASGPLSGGRNE